MKWLRSRYNWLKFKTSRKLQIILEDFEEYTLNYKEESKDVNRNRVDLETLGSLPIMPQKSPQMMQ
jgi:hypothetical protein